MKLRNRANPTRPSTSEPGSGTAVSEKSSKNTFWLRRIDVEFAIDHAGPHSDAHRTNGSLCCERMLHPGASIKLVIVLLAAIVMKLIHDRVGKDIAHAIEKLQRKDGVGQGGDRHSGVRCLRILVSLIRRKEIQEFNAAGVSAFKVGPA